MPEPARDVGEQRRTGGRTAPEKESYAVAAPSISLPMGGRAIRGTTERFTANPVIGTGSISVPIFALPDPLHIEEFGGFLPGCFEPPPGAGWESFQPFASPPNIAFGRTNLKFVDLTAATRPLLLGDGGVFTWRGTLFSRSNSYPQRYFNGVEREVPRLAAQEH